MNQKIRKAGRTALSIALAAGLVLGSTCAEAKKVSKQETVYVNADPYGTVTDITVSDWLKNSGVNSVIEDSSTLSDITNTKGDEKFSQTGEDVSWSAGGDDIYYQGKSNQALPVDVKISYSLDGTEMKAEEILGKSGRLKIHVSYENKSKSTAIIDGEEKTIYTPFVMVTGMILDNEVFSNVTADNNAKVVNDGSKQMVFGIGTPGLAESLDLKDEMAEKIPGDFTVTADVTDFSMGNTFTFGSPSLLSELDLDDSEDMDELEDKLDDMTSAVSQLVDGSDKIADNMETFAEKMGMLKDSIQKYKKEGVGALSKGINQLAANGPKLVKGVGDYTDGAVTLAKGTKSYVEGAGQITKGNIQLYNAVKDMPTQMDTFAKGLKSYTDGVDKLGAKENVTKLKSGAKSVSDGVSTLNASLAQLKQSFDNNEKIIAGLKASGADATLIASLEQVTGTQKAAIAELEKATSAEGDLKKGAEALSSGVGTVMDSLATLSGNSATLTGAADKLSKNLPTLVSNIKKLKEGSEKLSSNDKKLIAGTKQIIKASKKMNKTAKTLNKGMKTLRKGSNKLGRSTDQLVSGVSQLTTASGQLSDGADELASGVDEFNSEGVEKLQEVYDDDVKGLTDRLQAIVDAGKDYRSFSGIHKAMDGEVKFVIETKEVKKDEE